MRRFLLLTLFFCFATITVWAQLPLAYIPIGPCRIVDTRPGSGQPTGFGGPTPGTNSLTTFILPKNPNCNVPNEAFAYALNVTVVPNGQYLGWLTVFADDQSTPPPTSTLNSYDGRTKANAAIVAAGAKDQGITVYVTDPTDVVIDVTGYFVPSMINPPVGALHYFSLPQTQVCNIFTTLVPPNQPLAAGTTTQILPQTPGVPANYCQVPSTALAYSLNVTAVPVGAQPLQYLQVWPDDQPSLPNTSVLNAPTGTTVANATIVQAGSNDGGIFVYNSDATDLTVDINGYFAYGDNCSDKVQQGDCALALYMLTPACRPEDTRNVGASGPYVGPQGFDIHTGLPGTALANYCTIPAVSNLPPAFIAPEEAYVLNATVIPDVIPPNPGGLGAMTIWPAGFPLPVPATLEALDGYVASNMTIVPSFSGFYQGVVNTNASNPTNLALDMSAFFAVDTVTVVTPNLPDGTDNVPYVYNGNPGPFQMLAWGGVGGPYTWVINNLPVTLGYTPGGLVGGVPDPGDCPQAPPGAYFPTAQATDGHGNTSPVTNLTITIKPALQPVKITTTSLPPAPVNTPYSQQVVAVNGLVGTYTFTYTGQLPDNFSLNSATGVISSTLGPPIQDNGITYNFVVTVTDQQCPAGYSGGTYSQALSISVPVVP